MNLGKIEPIIIIFCLFLTINLAACRGFEDNSSNEKNHEGETSQQNYTNIGRYQLCTIEKNIALIIDTSNGSLWLYEKNGLGCKICYQGTVKEGLRGANKVTCIEVND